MRLPRAMLRHRVELEPRLGSDANGPLYGPGQERRAYVEDSRRANTGVEGRTVSYSTVVWIELDLAVDAEWRVKVRGQGRDVVEVRHYESLLGTPDHTEIRVR